jgi:putative transposase
VAALTRPREGCSSGEFKRSSQHTIRYTQRLAEAGALASIGSVGDSYDCTVAESVIGLFKTELVRWEW